MVIRSPVSCKLAVHACEIYLFRFLFFTSLLLEASIGWSGESNIYLRRRGRGFSYSISLCSFIFVNKSEADGDCWELG